MGKIKFLSDDLINQIAAGEIVERPCSALKEIVENAIDAGSSNINIFITNGGKTKIVVEDDGEGIAKDDLEFCIQRHATSKLTDANLFDVQSYGFRGEAIPSIASVSKFCIESSGFGIGVYYSEISEIFPSIIRNGTRVVVENLFDKTPVRLKFLKSDLEEQSRCISVVENFALIRTDINFILQSDEKLLLSFKQDSKEMRVCSIFGENLFQRAVVFEEVGENIKISGYLFHPLDGKYSSAFQKIFVNNRIVHDRVISQAIKNSYKNLLNFGRYPAVLIFIDILPFFVDVNVTPTKSEVRFREQNYIKKFLTETFKKNLRHFDRVSVDFDTALLEIQRFDDKKRKQNWHFSHENNNSVQNFEENLDFSFENEIVSDLNNEKQQNFAFSNEENFFGEVVGQVFGGYIVSQTAEKIFFIDMHAVHEKIVQTKLKEQLSCENKQLLLQPEIIKISSNNIDKIKNAQKMINNFGFNIDIIQFTVIVSAIPVVLSIEQAINFLQDFIDSDCQDDELMIFNLIKKQIADIACHNSIRFGRKLSQLEMTEILTQMEKIETIFQCNHHRQTFITISKLSFEKMFQRV